MSDASPVYYRLSRKRDYTFGGGGGGGGEGGGRSVLHDAETVSRLVATQLPSPNAPTV